RAIFR
ncbi:putative host specificity J domain protein, partial [Escherichia coli 93.0056]